jgi:hypothetical protein
VYTCTSDENKDINRAFSSAKRPSGLLRVIVASERFFQGSAYPMVQFLKRYGEPPEQSFPNPTEQIEGDAEHQDQGFSHCECIARKGESTNQAGTREIFIGFCHSEGAA